MLFEYANSSIKAILYGIAFILLICNNKENIKYLSLKVLYYLLLFSCLYLILISNSRIVWFGILAILYLLFGIKNRQIKIIHKIIVSIIGIIVGVSCFFFKLNSSLGRLHIYKINFLILKDYWQYGINKPYNILYNHYQAEYFLKKSTVTINEKLLASNGFFVFNEWLNIFLHFGIFGFIATILLSSVLLYIALKKIYANEMVTESSIIIFLLIVSTVSYPFSFNIFQLILVVCLIRLANKRLVKKKLYFVFLSIYIIGIAFFASKEYSLYKYDNRYKSILTLFQTGYFNKSLELYHQNKEDNSFTG